MGKSPLKIKLIASVSMSITGVLVLYAAFAFGGWRFNPGEWHELGRGMFALISVFMLILPTVFVIHDHYGD